MRSLPPGNSAPDGRRRRVGHGAPREHGFERLLQIAPRRLGPRLAEVRVPIVDAPAVNLLAAGPVEGGLGGDLRSGALHQRVRGIAKRVARQTEFALMLLDGGGGVIGVRIDAPDRDAAWGESFVQPPK